MISLLCNFTSHRRNALQDDTTVNCGSKSSIANVVCHAFAARPSDTPPATATGWHADTMDYILEHRKTCFPACLFLPEAPDVVIASTDTDNQETSLVTAFDILLENANQSCVAKHGTNASEAAMLDSNGLTDVDMLLCGSLLILKVIHILFVSHKNNNSVSAAKNTLHETLVVLNSEYTTHQSSQPPQPSHGTAQLAMAVVHQSMVFVRTYMGRFPQLAGVHLDMLMQAPH